MSKTRRSRKREISLPRSVRRLHPNVTRCYDSDEPIEVSVCKDDVTTGRSKDFGQCALAKAFIREHKADAVVIALSVAYVIRGNTATRYATPESVRREIAVFDRHHDFMTGSYVLPPKRPSQRLGAQRAQPAYGPGSPRHGKMLKHIHIPEPNVRTLLGKLDE